MVFDTDLRKRRAVGVVLLAALLLAFLLFNRMPKLDTVRADLDAAVAPRAECFQGFCAESTAPLLSRWWRFSTTYLGLVTIGMTFGFVVAGLTEAFLFPGPGRPRFSSGVWGALRGTLVGQPMTLCSACIVPIAAAFRQRGAAIESTVAIVQGSSTLNLPALFMAFVVFTPMLAGSRLGLSVVGALAIGPLVALAAGRRRPAGTAPLEVLPPDLPSTWRRALAEGVRDWVRATVRYVVRLGPLMVVAAFGSGLVIQLVTPNTVGRFLGDNMVGVAVAATLGVLINVPLLFEIPLVAVLLLIGMGEAPAATLLFTAAAGGPITFWGLSKVMPLRAIATFGAATWGLGLAGGLAVILLSSVLGDGQIRIRSALASAREEPGASTAVGPAASVAQPPSPEASSYRGPRFTDVALAAGIDYVQTRAETRDRCASSGEVVCDPFMTGGAAAGDYDGDGFIDLYVTRNDAADILYRNRGDGTFEDVTELAGLTLDVRSNGAAWADVDNDGDLDLYVTTFGGERFYLFINDGEGHFTEEAVERGASMLSADTHMGFSVAFGDYDRDGWLDIYTTEWRSNDLARDHARSNARLLRNRGAEAPGRFVDVTVEAGVALETVAENGVWAFAGAFIDLDDDGWPDLVVASDYGNSRLFWNNGGRFVDGTAAAGVGTDENGMGSALGDYDGDGRIDWFVTSVYVPAQDCSGCFYGMSGNRLYRNEGTRTFSDRTDAANVRDGSWGWGAAFIDYDNDGDLDLVMTNGIDYRVGPNDLPPLIQGHLDAFRTDRMRFWRNDGGVMTELSDVVGITDRGSGKGLLVFDYDNDGDQDIFVVNNAGAPRLYRNDGGNARDWLRIRLAGADSNREGIGARIMVQVSPDGPELVREVRSGGQFLSQSETIAHFGLGSGDEPVFEVRIHWPKSGKTEVISDVPRNTTLVVVEQ